MISPRDESERRAYLPGWPLNLNLKGGVYAVERAYLPLTVKPKYKGGVFIYKNLVQFHEAKQKFRACRPYQF